MSKRLEYSLIIFCDNKTFIEKSDIYVCKILYKKYRKWKDKPTQL